MIPMMTPLTPKPAVLRTSGAPLEQSPPSMLAVRFTKAVGNRCMPVAFERC